eukprot:PITA_36049
MALMRKGNLKLMLFRRNGMTGVGKEEIFLRQKSRVRWIKEGESNTKFFHESTLSHRSHNKILELKGSKGKELATHKEMEYVLVQHFLCIAMEPLLDRSQFINKFTRYIPKLVIREDNHNLNRPVSEYDVSEVINEMKNQKAPSPDGFNVEFFEACWKTIKQDILEVVEDSRRSRSVWKALNASFIALIPRLKPLLPDLILEEQTGYVEGRHILNNIIQAHEMVHSLKSNKQAGMIIQLDLAKDYDKLSWSYIRAALKAYVFYHNWIIWVMALASMANFSILLNGSPSRTFMPSKGLRQGDPLSPFLFVLMREGLGRVIKMASAEGRIQGLKLTTDGVASTHQQFVDDTMLQGIPTVKEAKAFKQILNDFAMATGTEVSIDK